MSTQIKVEPVMGGLNEVATLVRRLQVLSYENDLVTVYADKEKVQVHMSEEAFLSEFVDFDVWGRDCERYPFELLRIINGVSFFTIMSASEIVNLKESMPDQFDYILAKVQVEAV